MFFKGKNKQITDNKKEPSIPNLYLDIVSEYVDYKGALIGIKNASKDENFFDEEGAKYYKAANYFATYMKDKFPDEALESNNCLEIDIEDMKNGMNLEAELLFYPPNYPSLIYIDSTRFTAHFHTENGVIYEAENIQILPGLSRMLANQKINKLFEKLTIVEAKHLLSQMGILPRNSELEEVICNHSVAQIIHEHFFKNIIYLMLVDRSKYAVKRARLFADSLGIDFDFSSFERNDKLENANHSLVKSTPNN